MSIPNSEYWARRFKLLENSLQNKSFDYAENLEKQFSRAVKDLDMQIRAWYQRFAKNNKVSFADAQKLLTKGQLKEFKWTVRQYIERAKESESSGAWVKELENASARVHISRLEALKIQLQQKAEELAGVRISTTKEAAETAYINSYYHTAFEVQRGLGVGWTMQALNMREVEKILARPWTTDSCTFTARCWTDKNKLVQTVNQELTRMITTGAAPDKAIETIAKQMGVSGKNAARVVMTESAYFATAAQKDCYNELDVEKYQVVGALSMSTCEYCGSLDGKVFPMSDFRTGETAPPFHPRCRCTTAPYFADMKGLGERYARDVVTGKRYKVPKDTTYEEWKAEQDAFYGEGTVDKARKMWYNKKADRAQYEKYVQRLGNNAPRTFEDFQTLKYDKPDEYNSLCELYAYVKRVPEATKADYAAYKAIKATGISGAVRVPPKHIDISTLAFNDEHAANHGCSFDDALKFIQNAKCSITRKRWDGEYTNYYSLEGAAYIHNETNKIKTAFSNADFDQITAKIMEVFK